MLKHPDAYVVRQLETESTIVLSPDWKLQDLSIVAFAEGSQSCEVLQAFRFRVLRA